MDVYRLYLVFADARSRLYDPLLEPVHLCSQVTPERLRSRQSVVQLTENRIAFSQTTLPFILYRPQFRLKHRRSHPVYPMEPAGRVPANFADRGDQVYLVTASLLPSSFRCLTNFHKLSIAVFKGRGKEEKGKEWVKQV